LSADTGGAARDRGEVAIADGLNVAKNTIILSNPDSSGLIDYVD
jgi:hypothetical protein